MTARHYCPTCGGRPIEDRAGILGTTTCPDCAGRGVPTVQRFVVTYRARDGARTLIGPQQGRHTYATRAEAASMLRAIELNTSAGTLLSVYGPDPRFEVRPCDCWPGHFDPVGIFFPDPTDCLRCGRPTEGKHPTTGGRFLCWDCAV